MITPKSLPPPADLCKIKRALISVYDKEGVVSFARALHALGVELISTGGTARALRGAALPVTSVSAMTGYPEILDGRVKTIHPAVHGGLLARRNDPDDMRQVAELNIDPVDLVVANVYPFESATDRPDVTDAEAIENIDIGGPAMIRAAAKNFFHVAVVTSPDDYALVQDELTQTGGQLSLSLRRRLAHRAFQRTADYDACIARFFEDSTPSDLRPFALPESVAFRKAPVPALRYGENPHQPAAYYGSDAPYFEKLHGKALSYNNLLDLASALRLIDEFRDEEPTCAILKHTNPCGVASAPSLADAYKRAFATDRQSPFGGIVVTNRPLDLKTALEIDKIFTEIVIAPDFDREALELLLKKKNRRIIRQLGDARQDDALDVRSVVGGVLMQQKDPVFGTSAEMRKRLRVVTERVPTADEWRDLDFVWRVVKHVKSNAIVFARKGATLGIGAGQMSRIDSSEIAVFKGKKSELDFAASVVGSDAFFPFADGLLAAADNGARAAIQPGGSVRDDEVIAAANSRGMAMVFAGQRHFRH